MPEAITKQHGANGFDDTKAYQAQEEEGTAFVGEDGRPLDVELG